MILNILAAVLFSYYFIAIAGIPSHAKRLLKLKAGARLKPFDCMTCLSAWTGLALYFAPDTITYVFVVMFGSGYIGSKFRV
jgi:hypothetical protein